MPPDRYDDSESPGPETIVLITAFLESVEAARNAYQAVKDLLVERNVVDQVDMAIVGPQDGGATKILRKFALSSTIGRALGDGWGPATGLVLWLYPSAVDGTGYLAGKPGERGGLSTLAAETRRSMSWGDLARVGGQTDRCGVSLVIGCPESLVSIVEDTLADIPSIHVRTDLNLKHLEHEVATAMSANHFPKDRI